MSHIAYCGVVVLGVPDRRVVQAARDVSGPLPWFALGALDRGLANQAIDPPGANALPRRRHHVEHGHGQGSFGRTLAAGPGHRLNEPVAERADGEIERVLDNVGLGPNDVRRGRHFRQVAVSRQRRMETLGCLAAGNRPLQRQAQRLPLHDYAGKGKANAAPLTEMSGHAEQHHDVVPGTGQVATILTLGHIEAHQQGELIDRR